ncbi:unnamed protein product [Withania somnifera]
MELELGLALPSHLVMVTTKSSVLNGNINIDNFDDNFSEMKKNDINQNPFNLSKDCNKFVEPKTLPLLIWNGQPNEEEDGHHKRRSTFEACYQEIKEENGVVGWPPIKSWRKKQLNHEGGGGWNTNIYHRNNNNDDNVGRIRNSLYVKVKMEGIAIGRKIDLRLYNSYQLLTNTLLQMFPTYESCDDNDEHFTLLYQDKEGDWMLAGDVPWETFMEKVQRILILRNWKSGRSTTN